MARYWCRRCGRPHTRAPDRHQCHRLHTPSMDAYQRFERAVVGLDVSMSERAQDNITRAYKAYNKEEEGMKRLLVVLLIVALLATTGCANMSARQQRALSGGAIGAAGGAAMGAITGGSPAIGAGVGGAAGATSGYFWDRLFGP
jgi:osmotically inducible lipoprotein OsmB